MTETYGGWCWPVERHPISHRSPVVSDPFNRLGRGGVGHYGVDIMYPRLSAGERIYPQFTKWFEMPTDSIRVVSCGPGRVRRINHDDPHGISLEVDHHRLSGDGPRVSAYRHLRSCLVRVGQTIQAGSMLGVVGHDRTRPETQTPNHLHFELWAPDQVFTASNSPRKRHGFDPAPLMRTWRVTGRSGERSAWTGKSGQTEPTDHDPVVPDDVLLAEVAAANSANEALLSIGAVGLAAWWLS